MSSYNGQELVRYIRREMERRPDGTVSFYEYMKWCLYHPEWGYYTSSRPKVGKDGDFYTSASIGGLMGEMLAAYAARWRMENGSDYGAWSIVEWGGGTGALAKQILDALKQEEPGLYRRLAYVSVEKSGYHRRLQAQTLCGHADKVRFADAEEWLAQGPYADCLVLSNELLDAFPVHRLVYREGRWHELRVYWHEPGDRFAETTAPLENGELRLYAEQERIEPQEGQTIEINLEAPRWIRSVADCLAIGSRIVSIDYGDVGGELYSAHRMNGTLMCYREHRAFDDPYLFPGEQDMTAHVNFGACIRAGEDGNLESRLTTQKQFLLECGILNKLQNHAGTDPFSPEARKNRAIRQLLIGDRMSELFKVLAQTKKR